MDQVHTHTEGRKTQGQHQHKFPQKWIKFTHLLRAGKHRRTASAQFSTDMDQVHTQTEKRKTQEQQKHKIQQTRTNDTQTHRKKKYTKIETSKNTTKIHK